MGFFLLVTGNLGQLIDDDKGNGGGNRIDQSERYGQQKTFFEAPQALGAHVEPRRSGHYARRTDGNLNWLLVGGNRAVGTVQYRNAGVSVKKQVVS